MNEAKRPEKIVEIDRALNNLQCEIGRLAGFISVLREGATPQKEAVIEPVPVRAFSDVYNNIAQMINTATGEVAEHIEALKGILL